VEPGVETRLRANDIVVLRGLPEALGKAEAPLTRVRRTLAESNN